MPYNAVFCMCVCVCVLSLNFAIFHFLCFHRPFHSYKLAHGIMVSIINERWNLMIVLKCRDGAVFGRFNMSIARKDAKFAQQTVFYAYLNTFRVNVCVCVCAIKELFRLAISNSELNGNMASRMKRCHLFFLSKCLHAWHRHRCHTY